MVLMESYFFCASVRLGVLVICFAAALKSVVLMWVIFTNGTECLNALLRIFESHYTTSTIVRVSIEWIEQYPKELLMFFQFYSFYHILSCIVAAIGAYKLKKYHVIPLAIFEFVFTVYGVVIVIVALRIARHIVSLGTLILLTLALTAYAMLVAYDTLLLIAFIQIMFLVRSERYQRLYGTDPLNPQPIIIYVMPKAGQKLWNKQPQKWWKDEIIRESIKENGHEPENTSDYFQRQELLSKVLLRNAINGSHFKK